MFDIDKAPDPQPVGGLYTVGLVYDEMTANVELQVLRDLMTLAAEFPIAVNDMGHQMSEGLLHEADIPTSLEKPSLNIVYRTGEEWPYIDPDVQHVKRDLLVKECPTRIDTTPRPGYYLKEQGRDGANLTELYLNRTAPRGNGLSDALIVYLWG